MIKKKNMRKMNVQMILYLSFVLIVSILLMSIFYFFSANAILQNDGKAQVKEAVSQSSGYIEGYLERIKGISNIISMHPDTINYMKYHDSEDEIAVKALMNLVYESDEHIKSMALVGRDGHVLVTGNDMYMSTSEDMMDQVWYMEAKNSHQMPTLNSPRKANFSVEKEAWVVSISQEVAAEDEHFGVLLIDIDYAFFESYLKNVPLGSEGYAFVISMDGQVIYHPDSNFFQVQDKQQELVLICESESERYHELLTFKTEIGYSNWILVGLSSLENVTILKKELMVSVMIVGSIVLMIGVTGGIWISGKMTGPIKRLQKSMVIAENWPIVEPDANDFYEVESLIKEYNAMVNAIQTLMKDIKTSEKNRREFELKALQSQINPHFLYNTLDTIVWLAEFDEKEKVISVTKSLGRLLRVALKQDEGLVTLEEEMLHVESYLEIQKERYETMLHYEIDLKERYKTYMVPKLILQPIVENAIYHGIREKGTEGHIVITVFENDDLVISVKDDGVGFSNDKSTTKLGGVGLDNVNNRLKLIYGKAYGLKLRSLESGVEVQFVLPKEENEEHD